VTDAYLVAAYCSPRAARRSFRLRVVVAVGRVQAGRRVTRDGLDQLAAQQADRSEEGRSFIVAPSR